jgi:NTP pyrophosphatase (non-canonical NTP hydrolase)
MDEEVTISFLKDEVAKFIKEREWDKYHTPKNVAESIVIEASELLEIFQWMDNAESLEYAINNKDAIEEELADIIIYSLSMANKLDIDVAKAVLNKLAKNREKYPVEKFKGRYYKP